MGRKGSRMEVAEGEKMRKKAKKIAKLSTHLLMRDDDEHKSSSSLAAAAVLHP